MPGNGLRIEAEREEKHTWSQERRPKEQEVHAQPKKEYSEVAGVDSPCHLRVKIQGPGVGEKEQSYLGPGWEGKSGILTGEEAEPTPAT